jgi:hypothetical protein
MKYRRRIDVALMALALFCVAPWTDSLAETAPEIAPPAAVPETGAGSPAAPTAEPGLWDRTRETAWTWWGRSWDLGRQAVQDARGMMGEEQGFGSVWEGVLPKLNQTLVLEERHDSLPDSAWFGADKVSNQAEIDTLLDDAVDILSTSPVQRFRGRIRDIQDEIMRARADIADYRQRRVSAPSDAALKRTVADYDRLIEVREADIERLAKEQAKVKGEFARAVRDLGVELSDEQVEFLLSTIVGDNMVDLGILFDNVKSVTGQLENLVAQSGEDLASARRYYGMYVVLLRALRRMHVQIEEAIGERYVPQIDGIIARAQSLMAETRRLERESPAKRDLLEANREAQQLTIEAASVYRQYLGEQAKQVGKARAELDRDIAAAWNTYETVRVSGELVGLVRSSQRLLEALMNRQVPALRPFENLELRREFEKLTEQLRRGRAG